MAIDRRRALGLMGIGAAGPAVAATGARAQAAGGKAAFLHGVASGDPLQDRVVLWTRITPPPGTRGDIPYRWRLNPIDRRAGGARSGSGVTGPDRDFTVKVDVAGLDAGRAYTFEFEAGGVKSPLGRTRTLPAKGVKDAVLAVASCALYPGGYFNAYRAIADLPRVDVVLHLGDYIYEYGGPGTYGMNSPVAGERPHDPPYEVRNLASYRRRHAQYKSDPDLQAAHARAPWIVAWDDHETANDSYMGGAENHQPTEGDWSVRKAAALKAYFEWMPIREPAPGRPLADACRRSFDFGDLAKIVMLETRLTARDKQLTYDDIPRGADGTPDLAGFNARLNDPARRILGPDQEAWLKRELTASVASGQAWQVIGSGVVMGRLAFPVIGRDLPESAIAGLEPKELQRINRFQPLARAGIPYGLDMWSGYPADRERVYDVFRKARARPVVVSGDSHAFWVNELADASGKQVAVEFGGTSITSPGADEPYKDLKLGPAFASAAPEVLHCDQSAKGFVLLTLSRNEARGDLVAVSSIVSRPFTSSVLKSFRAVPEGAGMSALKPV